MTDEAPAEERDSDGHERSSRHLLQRLEARVLPWLALVVAYLLLSINVYLETYVYEEFSFGYGWLGPTEARVALIALNTVAVTVGPMDFEALGYGATIFDVAGAAVAVAMVGLLLARVSSNLRRLARLEPPPEP